MYIKNVYIHTLVQTDQRVHSGNQTWFAQKSPSIDGFPSSVHSHGN